MKTDDRCKGCKNCKKDWTKCGTCPVMMQWVKEHKHEWAGMTRIKWSKEPDEWYCSYGKCCNCNTKFMCSKAHYCPGCGKKIESEEFYVSREEMEEEE